MLIFFIVHEDIGKCKGKCATIHIYDKIYSMSQNNSNYKTTWLYACYYMTGSTAAVCFKDVNIIYDGT